MVQIDFVPIARHILSFKLVILMKFKIFFIFEHLILFELNLHFSQTYYLQQPQKVQHNMLVYQTKKD
jgi:hypothetical protein